MSSVSRSVPSEPVPQAPVLLAITTPGQISFQGSAGAFTCNVQRSDSASGPFANVATNVSDARKNGNAAYLPLYSDNPASGTWYYRIVAVNGAGESAPSNVVSVTN